MDPRSYEPIPQKRPELDFCSDAFNPVRALNSNKICLDYPNAKTYNNLAEYYSRCVLKKDTTKSSHGKDQQYDRDYSWYYDTLGMSIQAQKRHQQRLGRKPKKYAGWRTAKMRKYLPKLTDDPNREPCRSFPPLQSTKIIQPRSAFRKYKIIPKNVASNDPPDGNIDDQIDGVTSTEKGVNQPPLDGDERGDVAEKQVYVSHEDTNDQINVPVSDETANPTSSNPKKGYMSKKQINIHSKDTNVDRIANATKGDKRANLTSLNLNKREDMLKKMNVSGKDVDIDVNLGAVTKNIADPRLRRIASVQDQHASVKRKALTEESVNVSKKKKLDTHTKDLLSKYNSRMKYYENTPPDQVDRRVPLKSTSKISTKRNYAKYGFKNAPNIYVQRRLRNM